MKIFCCWLLVTITAFTSSAQSLDYQIMRQVNCNRQTSLDKPFQFVSNSNMYLTAGAPFVLMATGMLSHDKSLIRMGEDAAITFAISSISTYALKKTVQRERPFVTHKDIVKLSNGGGMSFPSGHTSAAFAIATSIALDNKKWYVRTAVFTYAGLVGYSRIHLGVHYPSDVLAGAVVGMASAYAGKKINNWFHKDKKKEPQPAPAL
ncbi:MAG: phosphatase PAP2 family protein [Chitinophagaceae bacterium]